MDIFLASVIRTVPKYGIAVVSPFDGTVGTKKSSLIAALPISDNTIGVNNQIIVADGSNVICAQSENSPFYAHIIAVINKAVFNDKEFLKSKQLYDIFDFTSHDLETEDAYLDTVLRLSNNSFKGMEHNIDMDALPGDYDAFDTYGTTGLHIGRYVSQLRGSPLAFIDVSSDSNKIRLVSEALESMTLTTYSKKDSDITVSNKATDIAEMFGFKTGTACFKESAATDDKYIEPLKKDAIPFYRIQHMEGAVIDGVEHNILAFPDAEYHNISTEPPILSKQRTALSGELSEASTYGMTSIKTPYVYSIQQTGYGADVDADFTDEESIDDILTPCKYKNRKYSKSNTTASLEDRITNAAITKAAELILTDDYIELLQKKLAAKGLVITTKETTIGSTYFKDTSKSKIYGPTDNQHYPLPDTIQLEDPVTKEKKLYFNSTSFISQEPDGSILLCDGYGSEIRMSRGNIYISPALDLFLRPGRDLSAMVPRHQSYNSQDTCTINTGSSMYIRANEDLKIAGATNGNGTVVIENNTKPKNYTKGILIKSNSGVAMIGRADVYIGRGSISSDKKRQITKPDTSGSIIIDSGDNGSIYTKSQTYLNKATLNCTISTDTAAVALGSYRIGLYSKVINAPAQIHVQPVKDSIKVGAFESGKMTYRTISTVDSPAILLPGLHLYKDSIAVNGSIRSNKQIVAGSGFVSKEGQETIPGISKEERSKAFKTIDSIPIEEKYTLAESVTLSLSVASFGVYQDYYLATNAFNFPSTYRGISVNYVIPSMKWQITAWNKGVNDKCTWKETYYTDAFGKITACYPGRNIWESCNVTKEDYKKGYPLRSLYIINTIRND